MEKTKAIKYNILCKGNNEKLKNLLKKVNSRKQFFSPLSNNNNTRLTNDTSFNNEETNKFKYSSKKFKKDEMLLMNKTYFNSDKINKKFKCIINSKTRKKLKYLDNNELNYIFSEQEVYNNFKLSNNEEKKKTYLSSSTLLSNQNQNQNKKKYIINFSKDSTNKAVLDANLKNNQFNFSPEENYKRNIKKKNSVKRFSVTALFALKIMDPSEVLEEHIDSSLKINNKFARFKLMLKKQKDKNIKLLNQIKEDRVMNENMLKVYVNQITKKHLGYH